ncbi:MAG: hypothetical protein RL757_359 [Bacteroidota bacterium]|jgi:hypothetical protein
MNNYFDVQEKLYDKFVSNEDDFVGMIAYADYKQRENTWAMKYFEKHGKTPTHKDIGEFALKYDTNSKDIEDLRDRAAKGVERLVNTVVNNTKIDALDNLKPKGFWYGTSQSLVASLIWSFLLFGIVFFSWIFKLGFPDAVDAVFQAFQPNKKDNTFIDTSKK